MRSYPESGVISRVVVLSQLDGDACHVGRPHGRLCEADIERRRAVEDEHHGDVGIDRSGRGIVGVQQDALRQRARTHDEVIAVGVQHFQVVEAHCTQRKHSRHGRRRTSSSSSSSNGIITIRHDTTLFLTFALILLDGRQEEHPACKN